MKKIPTVFVRDWDSDPKHVTREVNPECAWVFAGEGRVTRKYDGTCCMFDGEAWWARREVKPDRADPPNFRLVEEDDATGKRVGWEPIKQSGFAKFHAEAIGGAYGIADEVGWVKPVAGATYELIGPKINGNPEKLDRHLLVRHGYTSAADDWVMRRAARDYDGLAALFADHPDWEGVVWHHPDGRMAKIKARDFPKATRDEAR